MGKILIIAEKPSVATDLAKALALTELGRFDKKGAGRDIYFENDKAVITSAVGHLVELKMPTGPNGKNLAWNFNVLPAIPEKFELQPIEASEARLKQVLKLAARKDVDTIVNACDAGREGELIFHYILEIGGVTKPVKRLWMQSMTNQAILDAWNRLRSGAEMQDLTDAAKCRSESDWLVGLNSTRALTVFNSRHGGFNITAAGRVQTPTLAILAKREREIREFVSSPYTEVLADFQVTAGEYQGRWIDEEFKKSADQPHARAERLWNPADAEAIKARCEGMPAVVTEETKPQTQAPPQLFDLTSLQREASGRFGYSARRTLQIAQALYEKHKMLTYPRTDSKYLPEDYIGDVKKTIGAIGSEYPPLAKYAKDALDNGRVVATKRVFDNAKISDHFAIIPTGHFARLSDDEQKLYDLVAKRFLGVFFPAAEFELTKRLTRIHHPSVTDTFRTDGKILTKAGFLAIYGRQAGVSTKEELCAVKQGESAKTLRVNLKHEVTKPPARFNEATLLSAMEGAGKLVVDEDLREAMAERGLGTPATRAATIEGLITQKYIARDGRELLVTNNGMRLIEIVGEIGIEALASPSMTGDWEYKLRQMEQGKLGRPEFMREILDLTCDIVARTKGHAEKLKNQSFPDLKAPCPKCGAPTLKQTDATYECTELECGFKTNKYIAGRLLSEDEARTLFTTKFVGPLEGFRSRFNKPFDAGLAIDDKFKLSFVFDQDEPESAADLSEDQVVATVSRADGRELKVYATEKAYFVPQLTTKKDSAGIRIGRFILGLEIPEDQVLKLIATGKTDLLPGFVSKRTKRKFSAFLTFDPESGKVGFEFEERKSTAKNAPANDAGTADAPVKKATKKTAAKKTARKATKKAAKKAAKKIAKKALED
jgi:DNA topoisomerase-3